MIARSPSCDSAPSPLANLEYVSASRLNLWLKCPLAYKFRYYEGIQTPLSKSLLIGTQVHSGLEYYNRNRQCGVEVSPEAIDAYLDSTYLKDSLLGATGESKKSDKSALLQQAKRLIRAYLGSRPDHELQPVAVETRLEAQLIDPGTGEDLGIPFVGIVDLIEADQTGGTIVDYKTAAKSSPPHEITQEVQLSCYSYLFRAITKQEEKGLEIRSLIKTSVPKVVTHRYEPRTEVHYRRLFAAIRSFLDDLDANRFVYRPGFGCSMCEFRDPCSAWQG